MGNAFGAIVTIVIIIAGIIQALAPVFKSIAEANEKAKRQSMPNSGGPRGRNADAPSSFLPDMTQQDISRPASVAPQPPNAARSTGAAGTTRGKSERSKKQKAAVQGKASQKSTAAGGSPGSGVGAHVASYIGQHVKTHIGNQIGDSVKNDISDQVRSHLGEDKNKPTAPTVDTTHGSVAAGNLLSALRSPQGVRQAILISEVLSKPKALRRT